MDYKLIKENFDKATAELEDTGTLAQQGEPAFAVGEKVKFSSAYTGRRFREARGRLQASNGWNTHSRLDRCTRHGRLTYIPLRGIITSR